MFRNLLIIPCLIGFVGTASAQNAKNDKTSPATGKQQEKTIDYKQKGAPLPAVKFFTSDGKYLTNETLNNDANLFLMLFNPTCEHCEDMTVKLKEHISLFKQSNLVLVAGSAMAPYFEYFTNNTRIKDVPAIRLAVDSSNYIEKTFHYRDLPQINIYNSDRQLLRTFNGSIPMDSLKQYIQ